MIDVAIIGAGPYGLSVAAYLEQYGVNFRIFGRPMDAWISNMPKGMRLKSEGFATSLYDPQSVFRFDRYCRDRQIPYADVGQPVPLETFSSYGLEFQKKFAPRLEQKLVVALQRKGGAFQITLEDGEELNAHRVIMAVGLSQFEYVPPMFSHLGEEWVTHSCRYGALDHFKGRDVVVLGAGSSALDFAALLHQVGAFPRVLARKRIIFHDPPRPGPRSLSQRVRSPVTGLGAGPWRMFISTKYPLVFRQCPERFRHGLVNAQLAPRPAWFVKEEVLGKVPLESDVNVSRAEVRNHRLILELTDASNRRRTVETQHLIAATGYKIDLAKISFLDRSLLPRIRCAQGTPILSTNFESSLPGLYFVGAASANTFGPQMRFAFGAEYTAQRLSRHLLKSTVKIPVKVSPSPQVQAPVVRSEITS